MEIKVLKTTKNIKPAKSISYTDFVRVYTSTPVT